MAPPVKILCDYCGSSDVRRDAWAAWDEADQQWVLAETFDFAHCEVCGGKAKLIEEPL